MPCSLRSRLRTFSFNCDYGTNVAMYADSPQRSVRKVPPPLDKARLEELALAYVARFATSAGKLSAYLRRKLRERGWEGEGEPGIEGEDAAKPDVAGPDVAGIVARFVALGYVDDAGYARAKGGSLLRRGYGERRVEQALAAAGIGEADREEARASEREQRRAALTMVRKRRFGPFGPPLSNPVQREKQVAALLRAGHPLASARVLVDAETIEAAENWADEGDDG